MKKIFILLFLFTFNIFIYSQSADYETLLEQYPQLSTYQRDNATAQQALTPTFDFTDYTETELLLLDSLGVLEVLLDTTEVEEPPYFGYKFFNSPDKFAIFDNIPIPANYQLGAGDQLIISLWGATESRSRHMINREGNIYIDGVGQVNLAGTDVETAEQYLTSRFAKVYSTLKGKRPTTFLSITLGQLKSINISFIGEVASPGIHAVHPFSDITTALLQVGGVDTVGSLRNIHIFRDNKHLATFDFYEFLFNGNISQNIRLANGDVIQVPARQSYVEIEGEVNRPGIYEAKESDSIADIITHAGGLTQKAQSNIEIYKIIPRNQRLSEDFAYNVFHKKYEEVKNNSAKDLTRLRVLAVPDVVREVSILGKVKSPGNYAYDESLYVLDLLKIAGGLDDQTYLESIYTKEAEIIRQVPNSIYPQRIVINLDYLMADTLNQNIKLHNRDIVLIRENSKFSEPKYVTISGKVVVPGKYTIQKKEESLENIIKRAGGFSSNAYQNGLRMYRDSTQVVLKSYDMFVADGDSIYIPESPGVIKVEGQVHLEGLVQYVKGKSLRYYIERAGGYTYEGDKRNVIVQYANGNMRHKKSYLFSLFSISPPVRDGSTITVFTKEPKPPFNLTQFLGTTASAATSIATLWLVYQQSQ